MARAPARWRSSPLLRRASRARTSTARSRNRSIASCPMLEAARTAGVQGPRLRLLRGRAAPMTVRSRRRTSRRSPRALHELGCYEISLGDTIGVGTPASILRMLEAVAKEVPVEVLAGHYHDTYGMAIANIYASYQFGLRTFDSAGRRTRRLPLREGSDGQRRDRGCRLSSKGTWLRHGRRSRRAPGCRRLDQNGLGARSGITTLTR